jgi:hypothetical protein
MIDYPLKCVTLTKVPETCDTCPCKAAGCQHSNDEYPDLIEYISDDTYWPVSEFFNFVSVKTFLVDKAELC